MKDLYEKIKTLANSPNAGDFDECEKALVDWYAAKSEPDYRLIKLFKNLKYYFEATEGALRYRDELFGAIAKTLLRTADYDINIRDFPDKVNKWHESVFSLCDSLRKEEKLPLEEESGKPYDITVFMATYNQLELTKLCLDSVFKNTGDVSCELYLIDNGSSDGTYEFFKDDSRVKMIRLEENTGLLLALHIFYESGLDNGKFWLYMNNDVIVTPRWASNMLTCIKSDPRIASVMPTTNRAAAFVCIQPPMGLYDAHDVQAFGERYNVSNPKLWQDWVMYYGFVLLSRPSVRRKFGYYEDCFYFPFYFADGDITLSQTRAGYRTVQARDTYIHHFDGGHTVLQDRRASLAAGEKVFFMRHGFFSTDFERSLPSVVASGFSAGAAANLPFASAINVGTKVLFLGNSRFHPLMQLRSIGMAMNCHIQCYTTDTMEQIKILPFDKCIPFERIDSWYEIARVFEGEVFDAIVWLDHDVNNIMKLRHPAKFLSAAFSRLNVNGKLFVQAANTSNFLSLNYTLMTQRDSPRDSVRIRKNCIASVNEMLAAITAAGFSVDTVEDVFFHENFTYGKLETVDNYRELYKGNNRTEFERAMLVYYRNIVARKPSVINTDNTLEQLLYKQKEAK